jgi:hypothetical protein
VVLTDRMDVWLNSLERAQEEFHQSFNVWTEDVEEDIQVLKNDVDIVQIQMSLVEKDVNDVKCPLTTCISVWRR